MNENHTITLQDKKWGNAGACIDADYFFSWERLHWCRQFFC